MELRHLRYFLAVADGLNVSRAAERLRVAQPALSRQVRDLEEQIGFRLFERSNHPGEFDLRGALLPAGQGGKMLMQLDIAVTGAQRIAKGTTGEFRIGTARNESGPFLIADAARELHERHPELAIDFVELPAHQHTQAVRDQNIDVGFVSGNMLTLRKDVDHRLIYTCAIKAVLPMGHPQANRTGGPPRTSLNRSDG